MQGGVIALAALALLALVAKLSAGGGQPTPGVGDASRRAPPYCPGLPPPCSACRKPAHSWRTIPVFFHGSDPNGTADGGFTDLALDTITRFPLVTLEKWQGSSVVPYTWQEDA